MTDSEARGRIIEENRDGQKYLDRRHRPAELLHGHGRGGPRICPSSRAPTRDVARILRDFRSKGVDAVVLDLRRNGGGSLTEAISVTGLFIDQGPIVQVKDKEGACSLRRSGTGHRMGRPAGGAH